MKEDLECPKEKCFFWIKPGGSADMSGKRYGNIQEALKKGKFTPFPDGGCSCTKKCSRIHKEETVDYFEPI